MDEKTMVNDILAGVKSDLTAYQTAITEAENMQLRQTFQQIRNSDESFQYELYKIAQTKGYYKPAAKATVTEIGTVKSELEQCEIKEDDLLKSLNKLQVIQLDRAKEHNKKIKKL